MEGGDTRMVQRGQNPRLPLETGQAIGILGERFGKDFDGDFAAELRVTGAVDFAIPPLPSFSRIW